MQLGSNRWGQSILIVNPGGLGDIILMTATIREFTKKNPNVKTFVMTPFPQVFENNPRIEGHIPLRTWHTAFILGYRRMQQAKSAELLQAVLVYPNTLRGTVAQSYGQQLGIRVANCDPEIFLRPCELASYRRRNNVVVIDTWAGWPNRRWAIGKFKALVDLLHRRGMTVIETGKSSKDCLNNERYPPMSNSDECLIDKQNIRETAVLLANSKLAIGNNGGFVDIAAAVSTPQVVLYSGVSAWWMRGYSTTFPVCCMTTCTKCHNIQSGDGQNTQGNEGRCFNDQFCLDAEISPEDVMETCEAHRLLDP